jgi:hypothetical protein
VRILSGSAFNPIESYFAKTFFRKSFTAPEKESCLVIPQNAPLICFAPPTLPDRP